MHWQAIRRSTRSRESTACHVHQCPPDIDRNDRSDEAEHTNSEHDMGISYGHDNAADTRSASMQSSVLALPDVREHLKYQEDHHSEDEEDSFQVPIPTFTDGVTPFAYQLALRNRIKDGKLRRHGEYDMSRYTPTFIHDCLMLPGSLASLLGKVRLVKVV